MFFYIVVMFSFGVLKLIMQSTDDFNVSSLLETKFWQWFDKEFLPKTIDDYAQAYTRIAIKNSDHDESDLSTQNRLRNIQKAYRREIRFALAKIYAQPFKIPFTQTYAIKLLKGLFNETASSESINQEFACKGRTSKQPRVRFKPAIDAITEDTVNQVNHLYARACVRLETEALPAAQEKSLLQDKNPRLENQRLQFSLF